MDKSSKDIENSSSQYFEACSNSKELNNILEEKERGKESINNLESNKEYEIKNIYESPQRIANNNFNAISNSSTTNLNSSNRPSNIDKNVLISTKEKTNGQTDKTKLNKIGKKVNIYTMNCVKKNLMSPIEENINSNEKLKPNLNNINEITNNNNNNININIIINKNKQKENKFNFEDIKTFKNKNTKSRQKKEETINTNINKDNDSLYSSLDNFSNSTMSK